MIEIFNSLRDIPLDNWDGHDEVDLPDKSVPNPKLLFQPLSEFRSLSSAVLAETKPKYVPFVRTIKINTIGRDVYAVKRALSVAGYGEWGNWGSKIQFFGPHRATLLKRFQKEKGLKVDGVYGKETHKKLAPFFDLYGSWLLSQVHILTPAEQKRKTIVATAMLTYQVRDRIHYTQSSWRMQGVRNRIMPPSYPIWEDCSSLTTWFYWVARAADPNGLGYNGQGYTGTQINHGDSVSLRGVRPGDLVFYGWRSGIPTHVAVYVGDGRVVSHGSESGPLLLNVGYRSITRIKSYI